MNSGAGRRMEGLPREALRERLHGLGFDEVRFARAGREAGAGLRDWLGAGHHADMAWMERTAEKRGAADLVLPGVKTVVMLGVNYGPGAAENGSPGAEDRPRWAQYALYEDYHDTIEPALAAAGRVLEEELGLVAADNRPYVDTGPVLERGWAARSGLGFRGKNAMLISRTHGNWLFLACILTRGDIAPDEPLRPAAERPGKEEPAGLLCGKCTRCLDACPTQAFPAPGVVDARRCISYHTIENKGIIPRELRAGIGTRIYGCDVCLEVCPWNRFAAEGRRLLLSARGDIAELALAEILALSPARYAEVFRRTPIKRLKLTGLLRNACVVAGNTGDRALLPALVALAGHESAVVRAHAVWAVQKIAGNGADGLLAAARAGETDAGVLAEYAAGA
ncbi:Epoxyqueuosine reductase [Lacunisphaera limnophila]|uniref:Epoxyqueuosine reductase n=1 Tax=Lacunisphaera limnophila TaxID=1838286 RepID=A0A1D8AVI1_9BACT|nr:tRNA epoxyqueuosine(34) reductase QueG [Lacunisphaera limnophila]AOS44914.1 Epoxyqueuosine reductase [Lacunisphaera limnophila]